MSGKGIVFKQISSLVFPKVYNQNMKVLIYGFEPYGKFSENISQDIVKKLPNSFRKCIFPVKFDSQQFLVVLERENPDIIIGLGQHPRARKVRIERVAKNLFGKKMIRNNEYIHKVLFDWK